MGISPNLEVLHLRPYLIFDKKKNTQVWEVLYNDILKGRKRLFAPQQGGQEEADRLFTPQRGGQEEADRLFAPQRGGQEKQLCYSPRSAANKRFHFIIRPAADYVTRHLIGQFW